MKRNLLFLLISVTLNYRIGYCSEGYLVPLKLVEPAFSSAKENYPHNKEFRNEFIKAYCNIHLYYIKLGYDFSNVNFGSRSNAYRHGLDIGKKHILSSNVFKENLNDVVTPLDFGYSIHILHGHVTDSPSFEIREFVDTKGYKYHLNYGVVRKQRKQLSGNISIQAWVSPEAPLGYGHFNMWKKEIILIKVLPK